LPFTYRICAASEIVNRFAHAPQTAPVSDCFWLISRHFCEQKKEKPPSLSSIWYRNCTSNVVVQMLQDSRMLTPKSPLTGTSWAPLDGENHGTRPWAKFAAVRRRITNAFATLRVAGGAAKVFLIHHRSRPG
jgi:hypothetical protein